MIPKKVLIFGGTHGNEWTGIQIVKSYAEHFKKKYPNLDLEFILANPEAYAINRRFKDEDLNRAFQFLGEDRKNSFEHVRAKELKTKIDESPCLVIDLHTTTASMGKTLILPSYDQEILGLCSKLAAKFSDLRVIGAPDPKKKFISSQTPYGIIIEVGPVANGVLNAHPLESTLLLLEFIFEALTESDIANSGQIEIYEEVRDVSYPVNELGEIKGYIHSRIQDQDFAPVTGKFAAFRDFSGAEIEIECSETLYPIFVNEAAYYPQQLAFTLCRKRMLKF